MDVIVYQLIIVLLIGIIIGFLVNTFISGGTTNRNGDGGAGGEGASGPKDSANGGQDLVVVMDEIRKIPARVLHTVQGSISPRKGKVGELIFYTRLLSEYDRLIPLGQPIDFIGIKNRRSIDFIEVKTGGAGLSKEEAEIKRLVEEGRARFLLMRTDQEVYQQRKLDDM